MLINKQQLRKTLLLSKSNLESAIKSLEKSSLQIVLVVNEKKELIGTITDGDIRRKLLKGFNLSTPVSKILKKNYFSISNKISTSEATKLMLENNVLHIPLINKTKKVIGLYIWQEKVKNKRILNTMIILAGGQGKRLRPLTAKTPKPLLKIMNKPILEHIIINAKNQGINNFIISINYLGKKIVDYFGNGKKLRVNIKYVRERKPLGTAGSIFYLKEKLKLPFFVINGDILTNINFLDFMNFHNHYNSYATMAVKVIESPEPYGLVKIKGVDITGFEEKPVNKKYINSGVYILNPKAIFNKKIFPKNYSKYDMPEIFKILSKKKYRTIGYPFFDFWADIGDKKTLKTLQKNLIF